MKILITGGTGLVGKELGKLLNQNGHDILVITRNKERATQELLFPFEFIEGDLSQNFLIDQRLKEVEAVVHLAGENIGEGRWSSKKKKIILQSRKKTTQNLIRSLSENKKIKVFISASAIGYYGDCGDQLVDETDSSGTDFLAKVCQEWESQVISNQMATRTVILRLGVVLSQNSGVFLKMIQAFRFGLGAILGSGSQWMSWIHIKDLVELVNQVIVNNKYSGVYNAVAPEPVTNRIFSKILAKQLGTVLFLSVPSFIFKLGLGEKSLIVLASQRVSSAKVQALGFCFRFATIQSAIEDLTIHH